VLLPFTITVIVAASEARTVIRKLDPTTIDDKLRNARTKLGLDIPELFDFERVEKEIEGIREQGMATNVEGQRGQIDFDITALKNLSVQLGESLNEQGFELKWDDRLPELAESENPDRPEQTAEPANPAATEEDETDPPLLGADQQNWQTYARQLAAARRLLSDTEWNKLEGDADSQQKQLTEARDLFNESIESFYRFKTGFLGGPVKSWLKEIANPDPEELSGYIQKGTTLLRSKMVSFGGATTAFVAQFIFSVIIMAIALFSFLLDGPAMLRGLKRMTPLDDEHEDELIAEFDKVSRAVVMATLLSALAQGILAAIGFYFAGMNAVILLMLLTSVLALVPFVGAAAVWVPASLWLMFVEGNMTAGIFLAIYGVVVISMADNVIKPFILHGQSNLHPLWALLSVLGGVSALGPIGILIGPMVVVFLQTLLKILQREIASMDEQDQAASVPGT